MAQLRVLTNSGPRNGLKIMLNTNQSDYCGAYRKYSGAGFFLKVHDPGVLATFQLDSHISLKPGYKHSVVLEPTIWRKKTETLGRCSSFMDSPLYPGTKTYLKEDCFLQCYNRKVIDQCQCLPLNMVASGHLNITDKPLKICWGVSSSCVKTIRDLVLDIGMQKLCPQCKEQCFYREFKSLISDMKFPQQTFLSQNLINEFTMSMEEMQKNILLVNFYFKDVVVKVIEESQAVTDLDLFMSIGGKSTLFLGMSVLSFGEVLLNIVLSLHELLRKKYLNRIRPTDDEIRQKIRMRSFDVAARRGSICYEMDPKILSKLSTIASSRETKF